MTFKDYVYMIAMTKLGQETAVRYARELACDPDLPEVRVADVFWTWFFEITREGVVSWNEAVRSNDYFTIEAMVLDFQNNVCNSAKASLGEDVIYVEDTAQWTRRVVDIYMEVFGEYIGTVISGFIPLAKRVLDGDAGDEGIDEL